MYRWNQYSSKWIMEQKLLASDGVDFGYFGCSISMNKYMMIIGAHGANGYNYNTGAAYIYHWDPISSLWHEKHKLQALDGDRGERFGFSVSFSSDIAIIGADFDNDNGGISGSAYLFYLNPDGSEWIQEHEFYASDIDYGDQFGFSTAINGNYALIGAVQGNSPNTGAVYNFELNCLPALNISPNPLKSGKDALFAITRAKPFTKTFLFYSTQGEGHTYIPFLNITLIIDNPILAGGVRSTNWDGNAKWVLRIPSKAAGRNIWFQACQYELVTNMIETNIQK